jgi:hypothetical protein
MRIFPFGIAIAAAMFAPVNAQGIEMGLAGLGRGECEQLRRACENKEALGEQGEDSCRRYRQGCRDVDDDDEDERKGSRLVTAD